MSNAVTCPSCRHEFEVTEAMSTQLSTRIRAELESEFSERRQQVEAQAAEIRDVEAHLEERKSQIDREVAAVLRNERKKLQSEARKAAELELCEELQDSKSELKRVRLNLKQAQKNELDLRRKERELQERADAMELEVARKLDEERSKYQADAKTQAEEAFRLKLTENELTNVKTFAHIDGVWVCSRQYAVPLAMALRAGIIEIAKARNAAEGRHGKADEVYSYLCSAEFTHHLSGIVEAFSEMTTDIDAEERSAKSRFRKRRKQLERAFTGTTGLYGDLQGLIGNAMPEVQLLELEVVDDQVA